MNGLKFLTKTNQKNSWTLASYHSPHSLTWRWIISFSLFRGDEGRIWPIWMSFKTNNGYQLTVRIPFIGFVRFVKQRPIWYRDMYRRLRDERDQEAYQRSIARPVVDPDAPVHHAPERLQ